MGKKNIGGAVLDDLKALPKKILKPYYKNGKLNANKVACLLYTSPSPRDTR